MKAKYEKMIDEYVKRHYGDLDRGVLSPEVKYKVLFKIYRKKYRKARETAKVLKDVVCSWHIENDSEGNLPCSGCEHYVPMHPEELNIIPAYCKLGKSMTACCPFYSVKTDEKEAQSSYLDWLHDDITWCCRECSDMTCERNYKNRKCKEGLFSVTDMYDPFRCPVDAEMPEEMK